MKLKKREITLNEEDSLLDVVYFERGLISAYESARLGANRKEVVNEVEILQNAALLDEDEVEKLLKKVQKEGVSYKKA